MYGISLIRVLHLLVTGDVTMKIHHTNHLAAAARSETTTSLNDPDGCDILHHHKDGFSTQTK